MECTPHEDAVEEEGEGHNPYKSLPSSVTHDVGEVAREAKASPPSSMAHAAAANLVATQQLLRNDNERRKQRAPEPVKLIDSEQAAGGGGFLRSLLGCVPVDRKPSVIEEDGFFPDALQGGGSSGGTLAFRVPKQPRSVRIMSTLITRSLAIEGRVYYEVQVIDECDQSWTILRRYNDFHRMHTALLAWIPRAKNQGQWGLLQTREQKDLLETLTLLFPAKKNTFFVDHLALDFIQDRRCRLQLHLETVRGSQLAGSKPFRDFILPDMQRGGRRLSASCDERRRA